MIRQWRSSCESQLHNIRNEIRIRQGYLVDVEAVERAYRMEAAYAGENETLWEDLRESLEVLCEMVRIRCSTAVLAAAVLRMDHGDLPRQFSPEVEAIVKALVRFREARIWEVETRTEGFCQAVRLRFAEVINKLDSLPHTSEEKKQLMRHARRVLIPAAEACGANYFRRKLMELCFHGEQLEECCAVRNRALILVTESAEAYRQFDARLLRAVEESKAFSLPDMHPMVSIRPGGGDPKSAVRRRLDSWELRQQLKQGQELERSLADMWEVILVGKGEDRGQLLRTFLSFHRAHLRDFLTVEYVRALPLGIQLRLTDPWENNYRLVLLPEGRVEDHFYGAGSKDLLHRCFVPADPDGKRLTLYTYSEERGYRVHRDFLPEKASVLDLALRLDYHAALHVCDVSIWPWQTKPPVTRRQTDPDQPLGTLLRDGDVVCFTESEEITAKVDWFSQVHTEYSRRCLIHHFHQRYEV